ncbi:hypothetical protein RF55_11140, partial [Lasius niger]
MSHRDFELHTYLQGSTPGMQVAASGRSWASLDSNDIDTHRVKHRGNMHK